MTPVVPPSLCSLSHESQCSIQTGLCRSLSLSLLWRAWARSLGLRRRFPVVAGQHIPRTTNLGSNPGACSKPCAALRSLDALVC